MKVTRFITTAGLMAVRARIWSERTFRDLTLIIDTGSTETLILPEILDELGYSAREGESITVIRSAVSEERGYLIRVPRFRALGYEVCDFAVHAHDLPEGFGIDGLLGLSFLGRLNYEVRSVEQRILTERAEGA